MLQENMLIKADNLMGLNYLLNSLKLEESIDLVYIDPPFATGSNFTIHNGRAATISNSKEGKIAYSDKLTGDEYLSFLRARLELLYDLLSPQGSIYLHIDYKIGHYVKILMDEIFGIQNFRNDITRIKCNPKNFKRRGYGNIKDMILFYSKSKEPIWNEPTLPYTADDLLRLFPKISKDERRYTTVPLHAPGETKDGESGKAFKGIFPPVGRHWRTDIATMEKWDEEGLIEWSSTGNPRKIIYADEQKGKRLQDIWEYKDPQYPDYPTEKNSDMLEMIINTSSNKDSIVLDCFCGSGSTLMAAQKLGRRWIGIDQSDLAIKATKAKLASMDFDIASLNTAYTFKTLIERPHVADNPFAKDEAYLSNILK